MKKIIILFIACLCMCPALAGCKIFEKYTLQDKYRNEWGVELPQTMNEVYKIKNSGFNDEVSCTVYSVDREEMKALSDRFSPMTEAEFLGLERNYTAMIGDPEDKYKPRYENGLTAEYASKRSSVYVVYDENLAFLYLFDLKT